MICVIKVGGSSFSDKKSGKSYFPIVANNLSKELEGGKFVIVQGAGYVGHRIAKEEKLAELKGNQLAWAYLRNEVMKFSTKFIERLIKAKKPAVYIATSSIAKMKGGKLLEINTKPVKDFLENGFIPFLHSDAPIDEVYGISILSGDILAEKIAESLGADMLIFGTDVDGVLDEKGNVVKVLHANEKENVHYWHVEDVSGGIEAKINVAKEAASKGIDTRIINLRKRGSLSKTLKGEDVGTKVVA